MNMIDESLLGKVSSLSPNDRLKLIVHGLGHVVVWWDFGDGCWESIAWCPISRHGTQSR